MFKLKFYPTVQ